MCTCLSQDRRSSRSDELQSELEAAHKKAEAEMKAVRAQLQEAEAAAEANARRASEAEAAAAHLHMEAAEEATSRLRAEEEERAGVAATTELTNLIRHGRTFYTFVYAKSMYNSSVQFMNV